MVFDPTAFENLEALKANEDREADEAQIDAKLARNGLDLNGAKDLMYGDLQARTPEEIEAAKVAEKNENNPDLILTQLDGVETGEDTLVSSEEVESNINKQEALQEGLFSPRIDGLVQQGKLPNITPEEVKILKTTLLDNNIDDINAIPDSDVNPEIKVIAIQHLTDTENPENTEKYSKNFIDDFKTELSEFQNAKGDFKSSSDQIVFDMISVRYITPLEGEISPEERKQALNIACETALNTEIHGKQFDREAESYKKICRDIRNDSLPFNERYLAFRDLLVFTNVEQGKGGKQLETKYRKSQIRKQLADAGVLERFEELLQLFKTQEKEGGTKTTEIANELEKIRVLAGVSEGDAGLLAGGEVDKISDATSENAIVGT